MASLLLGSMQLAWGHGYITISRAKLCANGQNTQCGAVRYEPQSVEGPDRFPGSGPADGTIASAGSSNWAPLNEQSVSRWKKVPMRAGAQTFEWYKTAPHVTRDWRYFITKPNWNPNQPLNRNAFDLTPFCAYDGHMQRPPSSVRHQCTVPARSGYQIILAVWDVGDTAASFYHVIDADFGNDGDSNPPPPTPQYSDIGDINPRDGLRAGDTVKLRLFDAMGEVPNAQVSYLLNNASEAQANTWPRLLAQAVNDHFRDDELRAGVRNSAGTIEPSYGANDVYASAQSSYVRAEVDVERTGAERPGLHAVLDPAQLTVDEGNDAHFSAEVTVSEPMQVRIQVFKDSVVLAERNAQVSSTEVLWFDLIAPDAAEYPVIVTARNDEGETAPQQSLRFTVKHRGSGAPAYPQGRGSYINGDLVTGYDGGIYRCDVAGWCNGDATYYSPGTGLAWQQAWTQIEAGDGNTSGGNPGDPQPYPQARGSYETGDLVTGYDGGLYRCDIPGWCNGDPRYYAPGTGLAWDQAWTRLEQSNGGSAAGASQADAGNDFSGTAAGTVESGTADDQGSASTRGEAGGGSTGDVAGGHAMSGAGDEPGGLATDGAESGGGSGGSLGSSLLVLLAGRLRRGKHRGST